MQAWGQSPKEIQYPTMGPGVVSGLAIRGKTNPDDCKTVQCQVPGGASSQTLHHASSPINSVTRAATRGARVAPWIVAWRRLTKGIIYNHAQSLKGDMDVRWAVGGGGWRL